MAEKRDIRFSIISVWVGILIPIVAALIPVALDKLSPEHKLEYDLVGPITVKGTTALKILVVNNGGKVEKNVRVWLKASPTFDLPEILRPKGEKKKDPLDLLAIDSKHKVIVSKEREYYVVSLGDIRPREALDLSIVANEVSLSIYNFRRGPDGIEIKSEDHVAGFKGESFFSDFLYPFGFWMFVVLMFLILAAAIWQEYLMDPKTREKMILKEIDKLKG